MKQNKFTALALLFLCVLAVTACTRSSALTGSTSWPGITADGDTVYAANGSFVEAVQDGKQIWSYPESANNRLSFFAAPAYDEKYVYAPTYTNQLHILSKADGQVAATVEVGNSRNKIIASPTVTKDSIIVVSSGGMVSSFPLTVSGETITANWQTTLTSEIWVKAIESDGTVYAASMDKKMNLLYAATGEIKQTIELSGAIMSDPVLADGKLYFSTLAKEVDEMDLTSGEIRTVLTTDGEIWASPLLMDDKLIAADMDGYVYIVNIADGKSEWKSEKLTAEKAGFIATPIALDEETILLIDENGEIMTYDLAGKSVSQRSLGQSLYTTPALLESGSFAVIPVTDDGQIKAYTAELKEDWVYSRSASASEATAEPTAEATVEPTAEPTAAEGK